MTNPIGYILFIVTDKAYAADFTALETTLSNYYKYIFVPLGVVLAAVVIVYAGILYATSQGDPSKITVAKEYLFGAIIGLVLLLTAGWIVTSIVG